MRMTLASLSPEARVLLLSAGGARNDDALRALLAGPLDWAKLAWLADVERATPVLWARLSRLAPGAEGGGELPPEADALRRVAMVAEFRMLHLEQRLGETLTALERQGIEALLLKGAALAATVYGSFVRRPMSDVDLLVPSERASAAHAAVQRAGWRVVVPPGLDPEFYEGHHHLPPLEDERGTMVQLELHTGLFFRGHPFQLPAAEVRARAVRARLGERSVLVPEPHDQLLHLCLHFAWSHMLATGAWRSFRDLDALLATGAVRWDELVARAHATRGASCCYWTLRLARSLARIDVPPEVLAALRPPVPEFLLRRVARHFTYSLLPTESLCPSLAVGYSMWEAGIRPGWSGHGEVRPWDRADQAVARSRGRATVGRRVSEHLRNAPAWARYARAVLFTRASTPAH